MKIGIDLGGTKTEGIALDERGRTLLRRRVPSPQGDYQQTLDAIRGLVHGLEGDLGATGSVGVGMPGIISPATGLVKNANSTWLIGKPLDVDLSTLLARPVRFANDANCFALSEAVDGAAAGAAVVFGVIIGTGAGGGLVINGRLLTGANAIAGEWGHNPLPWPSPDELPGAACYCGRSGCIETFLSGPGLSRDYSVEEIPAPDVVERASRGEPNAVACLDRYEERMARALASIINVLDPDVIVLGGGLSNIDRLYTNVPRLWPRHVFSDHITTRLVRAAHGDSSGVRGAAWLWNEP